MNLSIKQKTRTHRHREPTCDCQGGDKRRYVLGVRG